jgi:hypothetical protein
MNIGEQTPTAFIISTHFVWRPIKKLRRWA